MKERSKPQARRKPNGKTAKGSERVLQDTKQVMTDLMARLSQKLAAKPTAANTEKDPRAREVCPDFNRLTVGVDLGDTWSTYCILGLAGETLAEGDLPTTKEGFVDLFHAMTASRVVMEVGTHSAWVREVVVSWGHEVLVANPRLMDGTKRRKRKNDRIDAHKLARLGRVDPQSLYPIQHRGTEVRQDLIVLRARDALVCGRTELINTIRGLVKSLGGRLPKCSSPSFPDKVADSLPAEVREVLMPLVSQVETLTESIATYDRKIEDLASTKYEQTKLLRQVKGVGPITALAYVLTLEHPERFPKSRDVGPYLGLVPRQEDSGDKQPQLGISKAGDQMLRRLLVGSAHYILGPFGPDTNLRRYGLRLCERGGKNAKKRAAVAVARKLAVLLHRLWTSGDVYEPLRHMKPAAAEQRAA
jgi:transposase